MLNLLHFAEVTKEPSVFLALDAEKAFDRVHWGYLSRTLHKFGISGMIHSAIMSLYSSPSARVCTSSLLWDPFAFSNGRDPSRLSTVPDHFLTNFRAPGRIHKIQQSNTRYPHRHWKSHTRFVCRQCYSDYNQTRIIYTSNTSSTEHIWRGLLL